MLVVEKTSLQMFSKVFTKKGKYRKRLIRNVGKDMRTMGLEERKAWGKMCLGKIFVRNQNLPKVTVLRRKYGRKIS